jgi:selenide,water dikinase
MAAGDDAGVYRLKDGLALVQTVDVFSPSVDDPYTFGQVAAANSLSDVYAMGGKPLTALSVIGFPVGVLPDSVMRDILRGGIDKMNEAGCPVVGGHSIKDDEIKAGFAVTGIIDPGKIVTNAGARPGDALVLTKPIGTGIIAFAAQIDRAPAGSTEATARSMAALNKTASELMLEFKAHSCTDVTGFGLIGHLAEMASSSGVDVELVWDDIPLFPGVLECAAAGILPGGVERNRESSASAVTLRPGAQPLMLDVLLDPQTSGGLLIVLPQKKSEALVAKLRAAGMTDSAVVGRVTGRGQGRIRLASTGKRRMPVGDAGTCCAEERTETHSEECCADMATKKEDEKCCAGGEAAHGAGTGDVEQKFVEFMKAANAPGALDAATKQAIAIALSVLAKCAPCVKAHVKKARAMGFTQEEIDEAVWMAIAFGGSPVMMFYNSVKNG